MLPKLFTSGVVLVCVLSLSGLVASADDKKDDKPALSGTWGKKDGELKIAFVDKEVMKIIPHTDPTFITIVCDYTLEKEGVVKAKITSIEGKEEVKKHVLEILPVGTKFSFKWKVNADAGKLTDVAGKEIETLKNHLEGEFEQKK
jgi:hypothetical protein